MAQTEKRSSGSGWRLATFFLIGAVICTFVNINRLQNEVIELQAAQEASYNEGYASGSDEGWHSGYDDGYEQGYVTGFTEGRSEWYDELSFFRNGACIVTQSGKRYHRYNCPHTKGHYYLIYNVERAEFSGYTPCLDCWVDDPLSIFPPN